MTNQLTNLYETCQYDGMFCNCRVGLQILVETAYKNNH